MSDLLLHDLVRRSARARPDATAVVDGDRAVSYSELDTRASQLAHALVSAGVHPGDRVGLYLNKSLEAVIAIYGVLRAGAAYVPLDPDAPTGRLGYIAGDCDIACLVSVRGRAAGWAEMSEAGAHPATIVVLDGTDEGIEPPSNARIIGSDAIESQPGEPPSASVNEDDLAYILYTSGSTGNPKGVMLSHRNARAFVDWAVDEFHVGPADRVSNHAPLHFDLSVFDLFAAASAAATLVLVPPRLSVLPAEVRRFMEDSEITIWYSVPSVLSALVSRGGLIEGALPKLRTILFAGEVFPTKYLRLLMQRLPNVRFANLYGPTETNVCTWYEVPPLPDDMTEPISIGRAIDGVEVFPVSGDGAASQPGETGELYVRGPTVMRGYWGDPERTARVLVEDPRGRGERVYRTGDLVQELEDGNLKFLGRRDAQIKSRGYRIELGEIEAALDAHPSVIESAAVAVPDELVTNRIKAVVVVRDGTDEAELLRHCAERIPRYMLPETIRFVDSLPRTSTGKIDRMAVVDSFEEVS